VEEISTHKVLVDSVGLWNGADEDVFKKKVEKKFHEFSAWEKEQYRLPFLIGPPKFSYLFFLAATSKA
jgi:hypothetical protein